MKSCVWGEGGVVGAQALPLPPDIIVSHELD